MANKGTFYLNLSILQLLCQESSLKADSKAFKSECYYIWYEQAILLVCRILADAKFGFCFIL